MCACCVSFPAFCVDVFVWMCVCVLCVYNYVCLGALRMFSLPTVRSSMHILVAGGLSHIWTRAGLLNAASMATGTGALLWWAWGSVQCQQAALLAQALQHSNDLGPGMVAYWHDNSHCCSALDTRQYFTYGSYLNRICVHWDHYGNDHSSSSLCCWPVVFSCRLLWYAQVWYGRRRSEKPRGCSRSFRQSKLASCISNNGQISEATSDPQRLWRISHKLHSYQQEEEDVRSLQTECCCLKTCDYLAVANESESFLLVNCSNVWNDPLTFLCCIYHTCTCISRHF